jgi:hypothetical protein
MLKCLKKNKMIKFKCLERVVSMFCLLVTPVTMLWADNKTITDIKRDDYLANVIYWSVDKEIFKPIGTKFKRKQAVTKGEFEKAMSVLRCKPYFMKVLKGRKNSQYVKKSEMVRELSFIITANMKHRDGSLNLPDNWRNVYFKDVDNTDAHFKAAQILVALGVLELNNGFFGIPTKDMQFALDKDPGILRENFLEILEKSFDLNKCGFAIKLDIDGDGVENLKDKCPVIPGNGKDGCPDLRLRKVGSLKDNFFHVYPGNGFLEAGIKFVEQVQIRIGDEIFAAILNPRTHDIITRSKSYLVEH